MRTRKAAPETRAAFSFVRKHPGLADTFRQAGNLPYGSTWVVRLLCINADKLVGLNDISGQLVAVDAARIKSNGLRAASRFFRRPVPKQHRFFTIVDVIPRRAFGAFAVRAERPNSCQIA